jgi:predicted HNH restriction endonuclease
VIVLPIPSTITKADILRALDEIAVQGVPEGREAKKFHLLYQGRGYPPKYVLSVANKYATGSELASTSFSGGSETNRFLMRLGFEITRKPVDESEPIVEPPREESDPEWQAEELREEGSKSYYLSVRYERDPVNRKRAIELHGMTCAVCAFHFEQAYGEQGKDFIEIHHREPLSSKAGQRRVVNPETDLVPLCSNCHRMIHRRQDQVLTVEELRSMLRPQFKYV